MFERISYEQQGILKDDDIWRLIDIIHFSTMEYETRFGLILELSEQGLRFARIILNINNERNTAHPFEIAIIRELQNPEIVKHYIYTPFEFLKPLEIDFETVNLNA